MSTIYGITLNSLYTVDPGTGVWTLVAPLSLSSNFFAIALVWNPNDSSMYLVSSGPDTTGILYKVNLFDGSLTLVANLSQRVRGLAYNQQTSTCYGIDANDVNSKTYSLDLTTGAINVIGPADINEKKIGLVYNSISQNLYGLSTDLSTFLGGNLNSVDTATFGWTLIGSILETGAARSMTFDPTTAKFYGSSFKQPGPQYSKTFEINVNTGAWTAIGDTIYAAFPQAMAVVPNAVCLHSGTKVRMSNGISKSICEVIPGDELVEYNGQSIRVSRNIMTGHKSQFVRIPANAFASKLPSEDLLLRRGHPLLVGGYKVPCQALLGQFGIEEIELENSAAIFTITTERESFVVMNDVLVGTWADLGFKKIYEV